MIPLFRGLAWALGIEAVFVVLLVSTAGRAQAAEAVYTSADVIAAIDQASDEIGVSRAWLLRVVGCETGFTYDPYAVGDHGTSFGAAQLHRGGSALARFYRWGYTDVFSPWQSVRFLAQEYTFGRASQWSCA